LRAADRGEYRHVARRRCAAHNGAALAFAQGTSFAASRYRHLGRPKEPAMKTIVAILALALLSVGPAAAESAKSPLIAPSPADISRYDCLSGLGGGGTSSFGDLKGRLFVLCGAASFLTAVTSAHLMHCRARSERPQLRNDRSASLLKANRPPHDFF